MQTLRWGALAAIATLSAVTWTHTGLGQDVGAEPQPAGQEAPPATVKAERYSYAVTNLDLWGKQVTVTELSFPDAGIVCALGDAYGPTSGMRAAYGSPGDLDHAREALERAGRDLAANGGPQPLELSDPPPRETVEVPHATFERIRRLADLTREQDELAKKLATDAAVLALFRTSEDE